MTSPLSRAWLFLAVAALAVAGIFSLPPVILRGPFFQGMIDTEHVFSTALVIHVDLSVLVWLLAMGGMFSSLYTRETTGRMGEIFSLTAVLLAIAGTIILVGSAFVPGAVPLKNNYIPVLQTPVFFFGLLLFGCGVALQTVMPLVIGVRQGIVGFGVYTAALITVIALLSFLLTAVTLPQEILEQGGSYFYEQLFWAGGHVLQFTFTQTMMIAWVVVGTATGYRLPLSNCVIKLLFFVQCLVVLPIPLVFTFYPTASAEFYNFFTLHMQYSAGLAPGIMAIALFIAVFRKKEIVPYERAVLQPIRTLLVFSLVLFCAGGVIALFITGYNVTIPAHYHGSIVGITTALMGVCYYILPQCGFAEVKGKLANVQPWCYAGGQLLHIIGLAWMGGYGALRKAPGSTVHINTVVGKLLFFTGGSLAIMGGLLFVIIVAKALWVKRNA